jgi:hypothetical protein
MGLRQQLASGSVFGKQIINLPTFISGSGSGVIPNSSKLAANYILLSMDVNNPCRVRLYQDSASVNLDKNRASTIFDLDDTVGLNVDAVFDTNNKLFKFDPPIMCTTYQAGQTWYNVTEGTGSTNVSFVVYNIGPIGDSSADRSAVAISSGVIASSATAQGDINTKKSFLILSGSSSHASRLRLYSTAIASVPAGEISRTNAVAPNDDSKLIADLTFATASTAYKLSPVLEGYSWSGTTYTTGSGTVGYLLENRSGGSANITATIHILSLED